MKRTLVIFSLVVLLLTPVTACSRINNQENIVSGSQATPTLANSTSQDAIDPMVNDLDNLLSQLDSQLKKTDTIPESIP